MPGKYLQPGQRIADQHERNVTAALNPIGDPGVTGGKLKISNIPLGSVALASVGTNTADVTNQWWITDIFVPLRRTLTGVGVLQGGTATTDKIRWAMWDTFGNLVCYSAVAGASLSGANTFLEIAVALNASAVAATSIQLYGPQQYFVGVIGNGTAAGAIQTVPAPYLDVCTTTIAAVSGAFATMTTTTITAPTTFTADSGPVVYLY